MTNFPEELEAPEIIDPRSETDSQWCSKVGDETNALLDHLGLPDPESRARLLQEAKAVISRCTSPLASTGSRTGLVTGYVQSGKTMSFTLVTALACDNNYGMVIVIGGTKTNLFHQSNTRLKKDLRFDTRNDRKWKYFENPREDKRQNIQSTLDAWKDLSIPEDEKQIVLLTVMKQTDHLQRLNDVLSSMNLERVPVLIIDDEADQAGLNNRVNQGDMSTIYRRLDRLRRLLPHHSYVQYTATPQAPLLINIADVLSPDFAEVLTPGAEYIGGKEFFSEFPELIKCIPVEEIPTKNNDVIQPPESFLFAMRLFYLGVASGYILDKGRGNRSMMIHPSQKIAPHKEYFHWTRQVSDGWKKILGQDKDKRDEAYHKLVGDFEKAYQDLVKSAPQLPPFEELCESLLARAINQTNIQEVNTARGKTPEIDWKNEYAHILVGGQAMDRGFTVEGLTVTYMPRGTGVGNADTLQQRARFFGYKRSYLGYCRVFLEKDVIDTFRSYVEHEENIREQLTANRGKPLSEWKRVFFLNKALNPTRRDIIDQPLIRDKINNNWYAPKHFYDVEDVLIKNQELVNNFWSKLEFKASGSKVFGKVCVDKHLFVSDVSLKQTFNELLLEFRTTHPSDSLQFTALFLQIQQYLKDLGENQDELCEIYLMEPKKPRRRTIKKNTSELKVFQGRSASKEPGKYPGDRAVRMDDKLTIQIHKFNIDLQAEDRQIENVPIIAIWLPNKMGRDWIGQKQGGFLESYIM